LGNVRRRKASEGGSMEKVDDEGNELLVVKELV